MKKLYRSLTAVLWVLCLGMTALADILPEPPEPGPTKSGILPVILIIALAAIAVAVLILVLRRRRR